MDMEFSISSHTPLPVFETQQEGLKPLTSAILECLA